MTTQETVPSDILTIIEARIAEAQAERERKQKEEAEQRERDEHQRLALRQAFYAQAISQLPEIVQPYVVRDFEGEIGCYEGVWVCIPGLAPLLFPFERPGVNASHVWEGYIYVRTFDDNTGDYNDWDTYRKFHDVATALAVAYQREQKRTATIEQIAEHKAREAERQAEHDAENARRQEAQRAAEQADVAEARALVELVRDDPVLGHLLKAMAALQQERTSYQASIENLAYA